ncbi:NAD(P)H-quinone oxidoreductase [Pseudarthrobacter sp. Y6]|uniref:NAD(P)H-quinone oxidoreductase n=1 Tax=Pseudarthrobacter sp. Y6 TaxID=3418422 RepID=UPI003CF68EA4
MYAITVPRPGGPDAMVWAPVPDPVAGPGEVIVQVAAAGVNRADLLQRQGHYPPPPGASEILGLECAGIICDLGDGVQEWSVGDRVCALLSGGAYAERVAVPAGQLMPVPEGIELPDAASLPEAACTVWSNLFMNARLSPGDVLLVHGGGSGIGTHAIQMGTAAGATVAATAGSQLKLEACRDLGAKITINYQDSDFVAELMTATNDKGADVILDNMGSSYLKRNVSALAPDGRLIILGMQGGAKAELNIPHLMAKRGSIHSTSLRTRPATGAGSKAELVREVVKNVWPMLQSGHVRPVIHKRLPVTEAGTAHELLDGPETVGKIVLTF